MNVSEAYLGTDWKFIDLVLLGGLCVQKKCES